MLVLAGLCALANGLFAWRTLRIALGSREQIEAIEDVADLPSLSIVIPARNEERDVETCVRSVLAQRHPNAETIVVDDRSEDATRAILERLAGEYPALRVVAGEPLPEGWVGKPWALVQGFAAARGSWILFTDADTTHEPGAAAAAQRFARSRGLRACSLLTDQTMITLAERALLPSILWTIAFGSGGLDAINDRNNVEAALFNGQFLMVEREAYEAIGTHAAVRGEVAEDLELARRFKSDGRFDVALVGANGLVRTRMYRSFGELWSGFVKNFALGVRGRPKEAAIALLFFALVAPLAVLTLLAATAAHDWPSAAIVGAGLVLSARSAEFGMRRMRFPAGSGLWLPLGLSVMLAIMLTSLASYGSGRGVVWRGLRYGG